MKTKKKPTGTENDILGRRKRKKRAALVATTSITIVLLSSLLVSSRLNRPSTSQRLSSTSKPKAVIVDHLSLTYPNQTFIETATNTLRQAGYAVDYIPGEQVTVGFFRSLPTHNYAVVILRVHSALGENKEPPLAIFTSELYSQTKYIFEQLSDQVASVYFANNKDQRYFAIFPDFITSSMNGRFENSVIIMMGCNGLTYLDMAKAFMQKGAEVYLGWTRSVLVTNTDQATALLLQRIVTEKTTIEQAVFTTIEKIGPDPTEGGLIMYYPYKAGSYTVENVVGNFVIGGYKNPTQFTFSLERNKPLDMVLDS